MKREYQMTIDFIMHDYDNEQEQDFMVSMVRRIMDSFAEESVLVRVEKGAEVE